MSRSGSVSLEQNKKRENFPNYFHGKSVKPLKPAAAGFENFSTRKLARKPYAGCVIMCAYVVSNV